jgi:acetolactate synthase I/II/III large subunit
VRGAQALWETAVRADVRVCFANPGTTEMPLVVALDDQPGIRPVLTLFEGVATGAADGYGRMTGHPAMTLLHLGPGAANGIANLHNARRARTPLLNVIGDHTTWHVQHDPPLASDIDSLLRPVSAWMRRTGRAQDVAGDLADAIAATRKDGGGIATLVVPADCQWEPGAEPVDPRSPAAPEQVGSAALSAAVAVLQSQEPSVLLLGGAATSERGLRAAGRIAAATGCALLTEKMPARVERGGALPPVAKLPYLPEHAVAALGPYRHLVLAASSSPVTFFGYPDTPSSEVPDGTEVTVLATPAEDVLVALEQLAEQLAGRDDAPGRGPDLTRERPRRPTGALAPDTIAAALAAVQPEGAIVVDEGVTSNRAYFAAAAGAPRHTYLTLTGGAIGQGLPSAAGAALACPDRPVIALQADGSALYTAQALWTMAREQLDVTVLLCANHRYNILVGELARAGVPQPGAASHALTDLGGPRIDWQALSKAYGVPAAQATTAEQAVQRLEQALAEPGPHLVELVL